MGDPGSPRTPTICKTDFFSLAIKKQSTTHVSKVPQKNIHRVYLIVLYYCLLIIMFIILSYLLHLIRLHILAAVWFCKLVACIAVMSGKEDKLQHSVLNYFSVQAEARLVLPVVSTPNPQPIGELQPKAVL